MVVRDPQGALRHRLLRTVSGQEPHVSFPLGEDDRAGAWQMEVTELVTGCRTAGPVQVAERTVRDRFRRFRDVVIHDRDQIRAFLTGSTSIELALDYRQGEFRESLEASAGRLRALGCKVQARVVRRSECREYPSRWWYDEDELEMVRPVEEGRAIGVRTRGAGIKGTFKVEDDNFRQLHLESVTRLKYKRNLILIATKGNWLYDQIAPVLNHQPTRNHPGRGQALVQMIWAPFDTGSDAIVINASDREGVEKAMRSLESIASGEAPPEATIARPVPRFTHPRLASLMGKEATEAPPLAFVDLQAGKPRRAGDNGVVKPSIYQIFHTSADGDGRLCVAASGLGNVGFDRSLKLLWKKHGLDVLAGPIDNGRLIGRAGGKGLLLNRDFSVYAQFDERVPFAVSQDGRVFAQRKSNTLAWSADGTLLWKRSLVGEALQDPRIFRAQARHIATDTQGRYVAASKAWEREEHPIHFSPHLGVRESADGRLLWHEPLATSALEFAADGESLVVIEGRRGQGDSGATGVRVVEPETGEIVWRQGFGGTGSIRPAIHPRGDQVVAVIGGSLLRSVSPEQDFAWDHSVPSVVKLLRFAPDGEHLAYATVFDEVTVLDREGQRVSSINCSGKPSFAWTSNEEIFFASERGHLGLAKLDGTIHSTGSYREHVEHESEPLSEPEVVLSPPSLYDTPFLERVEKLSPRVVRIGWEEGEAPSPQQGGRPQILLDASRRFQVRGERKTKHERQFLVFRGRAAGKPTATLALSVSAGGKPLFAHRFSLGPRTAEYVVGLPSGKAILTCELKPEATVALEAPVIVALPFEHPNLARVFPLEQTASDPDLQQYVEDLTLITEARCINYERLPADGEHLKLLNGELYDTGHWVSEKLLTVHDYVVRRKATSVVDFGSPIPVDIKLKRPLDVNCVISHHVPGGPDSPTAGMAIEVWDSVAGKWKLVGYREDNRDLSSVFVFSPVSTNRVRYWMLMTGNGKYGVSEVEIFGPTDPGMGSLEQSEDLKPDGAEDDGGGILDGL